VLGEVEGRKEKTEKGQESGETRAPLREGKETGLIGRGLTHPTGKTKLGGLQSNHREVGRRRTTLKKGTKTGLNWKN